MHSPDERSSPRPIATSPRVAVQIRKFAPLAVSLVLLTGVTCSDEGDGSDTIGGTETAPTGPTQTGGTTTGGTGPTATGGTGTTGVEPPKMSITLNGGCSLQAGSGGEALLVFEIHVENVGGPYEAETISFSVEGQAPLSGVTSVTRGYTTDAFDVTLGHTLDDSALGRSGLLLIETVGTTRGLSVQVPQGLGDAPCHLT